MGGPNHSNTVNKNNFMNGSNYHPNPVSNINNYGQQNGFNCSPGKNNF